jgi:hypothetical protein
MKINLTNSTFAKAIQAIQVHLFENELIQSVAFDTRKIINPDNLVFFCVRGRL